MGLGQSNHGGALIPHKRTSGHNHFYLQYEVYYEKTNRNTITRSIHNIAARFVELLQSKFCTGNVWNKWNYGYRIGLFRSGVL
jgi:hypothetical protein